MTTTTLTVRYLNGNFAHIEVVPETKASELYEKLEQELPVLHKVDLLVGTSLLARTGTIEEAGLTSDSEIQVLAMVDLNAVLDTLLQRGENPVDIRTHGLTALNLLDQNVFDNEHCSALLDVFEQIQHTDCFNWLAAQERQFVDIGGFLCLVDCREAFLIAVAKALGRASGDPVQRVELLLKAEKWKAQYADGEYLVLALEELDFQHGKYLVLALEELDFQHGEVMLGKSTEPIIKWMVDRLDFLEAVHRISDPADQWCYAVLAVACRLLGKCSDSAAVPALESAIRMVQRAFEWYGKDSALQAVQALVEAAQQALLQIAARGGKAASADCPLEAGCGPTAHMDVDDDGDENSQAIITIPVQSRIQQTGIPDAPTSIEDMRSVEVEEKEAEAELQDALRLSEQEDLQREQRETNEAILRSKSDPLSADKVVLSRLTFHTPVITSFLLDSSSLVDCYSRVKNAGCEVHPAWANGALLLVPATEDQIVEAGIQLQAHNILMLEKDVQLVNQTLAEIPRRKRPQLKPEHRADGPPERASMQLADGGHKSTEAKCSTFDRAENDQVGLWMQDYPTLIVENTFLTFQLEKDISDASNVVQSAPAAGAASVGHTNPHQWRLFQ